MELPPTCVLKFSANWCGPCKRITEPFYKLSNEFNIPADMIFEIDVDEDSETAQQFQCSGIPLIIFRHNNEVIHKVCGADMTDIRNGFEKLKKKLNQISLPLLEKAEVKL